MENTSLCTCAVDLINLRRVYEAKTRLTNKIDRSRLRWREIERGRHDTAEKQKIRE